MMINKKKAIEPVFGTVIFLLITITVAGLIFGVILPLTQEKLKGENIASCFSVKVGIDTKEGYTCYDSENNKVSVMVARGADTTKLFGFQIIIGLDTGTTQSFEINQSIPAPNEKMTYNLDITLPGNPKEVGIAPIFKMGEISQLCGIASTAKLERCS